MDSAQAEASTPAPATEMARRKVRLAWIPDDARRRATMKKRQQGIIKKVSELSTLCGVEAAAVIYGPHGGPPMVWPGVEEATAVLRRFENLPEIERTKKMMNMEQFIGESIAATSMKVEKAQRENDEAECTALMFQCLADPGIVEELDMTATMSLGWTVDMKVKMVKDRIETLKKQAAAVQPAPVAPVQPSAIAAPVYVGGSSSGDQVFSQAQFSAFGYPQPPVVSTGAGASSSRVPADMIDQIDVGDNTMSWYDRYFARKNN